MLPFYFRLFRAKTTSQLEQLATDISEYYKAQMKTNRRRLTTMGHIQILTMLELQGITSNTFGHHHRLTDGDLYYFICLTPSTPADCSSFSKVRTFLAYAFYTFPFSQRVENLFLRLGCPQKYLYPATSMFFSAIHVTMSHLSIQSEIAKKYTLQNIKKPPNFRINLFRIIQHSIIFYFTSYSINRIVGKIKTYIPIIPSEIICYLLSYSVAKTIQNIESFGLISTLENYAEKLLQMILSRVHKTLPPLPIDYQIPDALQCPICNDILNKPKESLGFFFCSYCIDRYMKQTNSPVHPLTREKLSQDMIHSCLIMNEVAYKFHKIANEQLNEENVNDDQ